MEDEQGKLLDRLFLTELPRRSRYRRSRGEL